MPRHLDLAERTSRLELRLPLRLALLPALALTLAPARAVALTSAQPLASAASAAASAEPPRWTVEARGGLAGLTGRGVNGFPRGPSGELAVGFVIFDGVEVELAAGAYRVVAHASATTSTVVPVTASVKILGPVDLGFRPYLVVGGGLSFATLSLELPQPTGTLRDVQHAWGFHAGLGAVRPIGEWLTVGADARYQFLQVPTSLPVVTDSTDPTGQPKARLDGVRLSVTVGARF